MAQKKVDNYRKLIERMGAAKTKLEASERDAFSENEIEFLDKLVWAMKGFIDDKLFGK